jgi:hypothetical protein
LPGDPAPLSSCPREPQPHLHSCRGPLIKFRRKGQFKIPIKLKINLVFNYTDIAEYSPGGGNGELLVVVQASAQGTELGEGRGLEMDGTERAGWTEALLVT